MDERLEQHNLMGASPLFQNVQPDEATAILARLQPSHYPRGTYILEQGVWHGSLSIIGSGHVSVLLPEVAQSMKGRGDVAEGVHRHEGEYIVAHLGPGECFGEMSLITGEPPTASVRTEQDTLLWTLTQTDFLTLIGTCPTLLRNINTILTRRLSRTNQQLQRHATAELIWLAYLDTPDTPSTYALIFHIAYELAVCTHKRVLLLELCSEHGAMSVHFATYDGQVRPSLLTCYNDASQLAAHAAPTVTAAGEHYPALAVLAAGEEEVDVLGSGVFRCIDDLARDYDYLLLATTQATPAQIVQAVADQCERAMMMLSADRVRPAVLPVVGDASKSAVFITGVSERPTLGRQDEYAGQLGRSVTRLLPADETLLGACWQQGISLSRLAPQAELTKAVQFVARYIAHQTIGIAFGGGGARGFAHLGVLERLLYYNVPLDYIAACSSGIITPGMYLLGKSLAESEEILLAVQRHIVRWSFPRVSLFSNKGMRRMLHDLCGDVRFEDLTTPFAIVAVDLASRAGVVLDRGLIWQAALAGVALPGIFPPVLVGEHVLADAGMHDPVPIRLVRQMGADILLASELGGQEPPALESATPWLREVEQTGEMRGGRSPHILDILLRSYDLTMATIGMHSIREADVVIRPRLHRVSLRQFSEGRKFIAAGRDAVEQVMPELRKRLPWL